MIRSHYNAARDGHAPGDLRDAFSEAIERDGGAVDRLVEVHGCVLPPSRVAGLLWTCTDVMPSDRRDALDRRPGSTYAAGARALKRRLDG